MKRSSFFILLAVLMSMAGTKTYAYDIAVENKDGITIYYNYINDGKELEVAYKKSSNDERSWESGYRSGGIIIPETVVTDIERKVTSIGDSAFCDDFIESVSIPNTVVNIGKKAFYDCGISGTVIIPSSVLTIGEGAFCRTADAIIVEEGNPNYMSQDGILFTKDMSVLLAYPYWKEEEHYSIPEGVKRIGDNAFDYNYNLASITIPSSVTSIGNEAFHYCYNLASITIPNSVTSIGNGAFSYCNSFTSITIPNSVVSISNETFANCYNLTSIEIPNSVTSIGNKAFYDCGLVSITIPNSVTYIGGGALTCIGLQSINLEESNPNYTIKDGVLFTKDLALLHTCLIGKTGEYVIPESVKRIEDCAFSACQELTSIKIPDGVTAIGDMAFWGCTGLSSLAIPNSVTSIGDRAFLLCRELTSITIPNSVTSIGNYAFAYNGNFTSIIIPSSVTNIGEGAFSGCSGLTTVKLPDGLTSIKRHMFADCSSLEAFTIPDKVTEIGDYAFYDCHSLSSIEIPNSVKSIGSFAFVGLQNETITIPGNVAEIGHGAFRDSNLQSIIVDDSNPYYASKDGVLFNKDFTLLHSYPGGLQEEYSIPGSVTHIGDWAFSRCHFPSLEIPNSVTSFGDWSFTHCSLSSLTIPGSVSKIGKMAFYETDYLYDVTNLATVPQKLCYGCFVCTDHRIDRTLHVLPGYEELYREADVWNKFNIVGDATTGISDITVTGNEADERWYNLNGIRVNKPLKGNVYIHNGKKITY